MTVVPIAERRFARVALACKLYQARLDRARFFRVSLFGDAAWDALLAIYVFGSTGRTLSAGDLCDATSETSKTSALRMQRRLADVGLIRRVAHDTDKRRLMVELTEAGEQCLEAYLDFLLDRHFAYPDAEAA